MKQKSYKKLLKIREQSERADYGWSDLSDDLDELEELLLKDLEEKNEI